jgi:steroid delta-isomerase-like uncharacterized protein
MTIERNKSQVLSMYELIDAGDVEAVGGLVSPEYDEHNPLPGQGSGREGVLDRFSMIAAGLAPQFTVEDVIAEGDRVVVRWINTGTHVGAFAGIPPTGRTFTISGIDIYRVTDGLLCEHWDVVDQLSLLGQLGLLPAAA